MTLEDLFAIRVSVLSITTTTLLLIQRDPWDGDVMYTKQEIPRTHHCVPFQTLKTNAVHQKRICFHHTCFGPMEIPPVLLLLIWR